MSGDTAAADPPEPEHVGRRSFRECLIVTLSDLDEGEEGSGYRVSVVAVEVLRAPEAAKALETAVEAAIRAAQGISSVVRAETGDWIAYGTANPKGIRAAAEHAVRPVVEKYRDQIGE